MQAFSFKIISIGFVFTLSLLTSSVILADYIAGEEANSRGDRQTAFQEFYAAAQKGDGRAYGKLGSMYLYGLGTRKDHLQAYIWFHMAYLNGERTAERFRDAASSTMTHEEYLQAVESAETQRVKQKLGTAPPQQMPPGMPPIPSQKAPS